jgi:DNA-binding response OmpR family regulator
MTQRILVVDNDDSTRDLFEIIFADEGFEVASYDYADIDLAEVQRYAPDLIILDFNVVHRGVGWAFFQLLKMDDTTAAIPVLVCTTTEHMSLEIEGYLAAKHIAVVRKPFDLASFLEIVNKAVIAEQAWPILLVEDNEDLADALKTLLQLEGYSVMTASNGQLALDELAINRYALILLDNAMPVMTGVEFLAAYAEQAIVHVPVIIVSAQTTTFKDVLPAFVMSIVSKPINFTQLAPLISKYVYATVPK